ncbi:MAG: alpha/beta fold hydrolase [Candidatus Lindowbacteria bacterium]|nr:alpha/beta fold hydrolase [Candidatus Lindowbacteria bacterium]
MAEQSVFFKAGELKLHGMFSSAPAKTDGFPATPRPPAVICHPHPTYGGTMDNNVVVAVARTLGETGHATLRFNFRGVERSEGRYGEGTGEIEDVRAAIKFVKKSAPSSDTPVVLAGYSFGSWVAANALAGESSVSHVILVAPPTSMFDFATLVKDKEERARHIIVGERDQFCDRDKLEKIFEQLPEPKTMRVIPRADHFFFGREGMLIEAVKEAVADHIAM